MLQRDLGSRQSRTDRENAEDEMILKRLENVTNRYDAKTVSHRLSEMNQWLADDLADLDHRLGSRSPTRRRLAWSAAQYLWNDWVSACARCACCSRLRWSTDFDGQQAVAVAAEPSMPPHFCTMM